MARVVIAGASGLLGRALVQTLKAQGHETRRLVRRPPAAPEEVEWDPASGVLDSKALEGAGAVVNLTGRRIAPGRWTARARAEILQSRLTTTRLLVEAMSRTATRPPVFLCASAIGMYGDRGDETLTEASPPGAGFLSDLAQAWEREAMRASTLGVRVACLRQGLILSREGGFLAPMLPVFRLGVGGPFGNGRQWWSWVHIDDVMAAYLMAVRETRLQGPVNVVGPRPATNREFVKTLAGVLRRPAVVPVPAFAIRAVFGQMGDETLLFSQRVAPAKLQEHGFTFRWPDLRPALEDLAGR